MSNVDSVLDDTVAANDAVGAVGVVVSDAGTLTIGASGWADREAQRPMAADTLFYIASMTKAVTSVAAMQCVERGDLDLDTPASEVLPMLANAPLLTGYDDAGQPMVRPAKTPITLRHLLTHTSGLGYTTWNAKLFEYRQKFPDHAPMPGPDLRRSAPLVHEPGTAWEYSTSTDFVGLAVEAVSGKSLGEYFEANIFAPIEMVDSGFEVPQDKEARVAVRYCRQGDGSLVREPPSKEPPPVFQSGGGGLYSTAADYAQFMSALAMFRTPMNGLAPILMPETMEEMCENQLGTLTAGQMRTSEAHRSYDVDFFPGTSSGWGLGFLLNSEPVVGGRAAGSMAWGGLYNSYYWIDPTSRLAGAFFTQVLPFADPRILARFEAFEREAYRLYSASR
ncbi:MAG: methyl acetate hydrolase [Gammaproteobacteria bacterium]|jgi:methyl acetate hydrolase